MKTVTLEHFYLKNINRPSEEIDMHQTKIIIVDKFSDDLELINNVLYLSKCKYFIYKKGLFLDETSVTTKIGQFWTLKCL